MIENNLGNEASSALGSSSKMRCMPLLYDARGSTYGASSVARRATWLAGAKEVVRMERMQSCEFICSRTHGGCPSQQLVLDDNRDALAHGEQRLRLY